MPAHCEPCLQGEGPRAKRRPPGGGARSRLRSLAGLLLLLLAGRATADPSVRLANGLRLTVLEDASLPQVAVHHRVGVGSAHDPEDQPGVAHLVEHLLFVRGEGAGAYLEAVVALGGAVGASTNREDTLYKAVVPPEALGPLLALEAARFASIDFTTLRLEIEKHVLLEERLTRSVHDPERRLAANVHHAWIAGHPVGRSLQVTPDTVQSIHGAQVRAFFNAHYRPDNIELIIAGPVRARDVEAQVRAAYAGLERKAVQSLPPIPRLDTWPVPRTLEVAADTRDACAAGLVYRLPPATDAAGPAARAVAQAFARHGGSALWRAHVQRQRTGSAHGTATLYQSGGAIIVTAQCLDYDTPRRAARRLHRTMKAMALRDWLPPDALTALRRDLRLDRWRESWDPDRVAQRAGEPLSDDPLVVNPGDPSLLVSWAAAEAAWRNFVQDADPVRIHVGKR